MTLFNNKYQTDSNRLKNWDYSSEAIYFITMVTQNREWLFGAINDHKMELNPNGKIIEKELLRSIKIRENWFFHNWVIMPNHIHLLIEIKNDNPNTVETHCSASLHCTSLQLESESQLSKLFRKPNSISSFVAILKSVTTQKINLLTADSSKIWQSNYHDHIVRNHDSFDKICHYIKNNPKNWNTDSINSIL
ncbi:transposase [Flavobacterium sp. W1B]|uniref:transposase n=1 Tax=Flavobacterium sp. W1B TaxID=3394146 RepID=UPI0039BCA1BD